MAVAIRLRRMGRKKKPFYRVIVTDERNSGQGKFVDDLGYYDPMQDPMQFQIDEEKALTWLKDGAKPSDTVKSLLSKAGILQKFHGQEQPQEESQEEDETQSVEQADSEQEEEL